MADTDLPPMEPVAGSSNVAARGYDPKRQALYVRFHDNSLYVREGVAEDTWHSFRKAPSAGKFVHAHLKPMRRIG